MYPHAPTLLELQRTIRQNLLHGAGGDASAYVIEDGWAPEERLGIYRNTAAGVVTTALQLAFPAVRYLVGPEFFAGAAHLFAAQSPPRSAWLDEYGAEFPDFLARLAQAASVPYLPDVARLEWQINLALHAPDAKPLELECLAQLNDAELAQLRFEPHPAARPLRCEFPADAIWHAVLERDDAAMAAIDLADSPVWLLVCRTENGIDVVRMREWEWRVTAALLSRQPLHAALENAPYVEACALLAAHLVRGCFMAVSSACETFEPQFERIRP